MCNLEGHLKEIMFPLHTVPDVLKGRCWEFNVCFQWSLKNAYPTSSIFAADVANIEDYGWWMRDHSNSLLLARLVSSFLSIVGAALIQAMENIPSHSWLTPHKWRIGIKELGGVTSCRIPGLWSALFATAFLCLIYLKQCGNPKNLKWGSQWI